MEEFQKDMINQFSKIKASGDKDVVMTANKAIDKIESNEEISKKKKKETREATGSSSAGPYAAPLFGDSSSEKATSEISGKVPEVREDQKGFKVPKLTMFSDESKEYKIKEEILKGGMSDNKSIMDLAKKHSKSKVGQHLMTNFLKKQLEKGIKVEMEHTKNKKKAKEIAMDHLYEDPKYYNKLKKIEGKEATGAGSAGGFLGKVAFNPNSSFVKDSFKETPKKVETKEATGSSSSGSYVTPAAWAKSMKKKDWRGKSKTQIPGGRFVQVKNVKNFHIVIRVI